jgi:pilus assembly protein CpaB
VRVPPGAREQVSVNRRALLASLLSGCLGLACLEVYKRRLVAETSGGEPISVLVVTRDIAQGAVLTRDALGLRSVPEAYVEGRQVREAELEKILGVIAGLKLRAGESLLWTDLAPARPEFTELSSLVAPGMRAMTVRASSFDGLLRPGDRVDVFTSSVDARSGDAPLLQDLVVLAVGSYTGVDGAPPQGSGSDRVTLAGSPEEAGVVATAQAHGPFALALRNPDDRAVSPQTRDIGSIARALRPAGSEIEHVR